MKLSQDVGRNEPCPCGSGRKFKVCCQGKKLPQSAKRSPARYVALGVAGVVVAIVIGKTAFGPAPAKRPDNALRNASTPMPMPLPTATTAGSEARPSGLTPQPPGPAPAGKVWSPEHGHWHDIAPENTQVFSSSANGTTPTPGSGGLTPQPPGPVPEGKVWSPEHGHWHDASTASAPPPPTPLPEPIALPFPE